MGDEIIGASLIDESQPFNHRMLESLDGQSFPGFGTTQAVAGAGPGVANQRQMPNFGSLLQPNSGLINHNHVAPGDN